MNFNDIIDDFKKIKPRKSSITDWRIAMVEGALVMDKTFNTEHNSFGLRMISNIEQALF
jgi:hypothetical protein